MASCRQPAGAHTTRSCAALKRAGTSLAISNSMSLSAFFAKAESDIEFEIANDVPARFKAAQDLVVCAPAGCLHEAIHCAVEAAVACCILILLISVLTV